MLQYCFQQRPYCQENEKQFRTELYKAFTEHAFNRESKKAYWENKLTIHSFEQ